MKAKDIYKLVSSRLQDLRLPDRRWPWEAPASDSEPSLQDFLNSAMLAVALQRPDATAAIKDLTLVKGSLQALGEGDLFLLDCLYALDANNDPVQAITRIDRREMDALSLSWIGGASAIHHWSYERAVNPRSFWVISGAEAGDRIRASVSEYPVKVVSPETELNISPLYQPALAEMVLYQVFASDTGDTDWQKAGACLEAAARIMGVKLQMDVSAPVKTGRSEVR